MGKKRVGVLLFDGFELLDVFGPLEMYGLASDCFEITVISFNEKSVKSAQGIKVVRDELPKMDKQCDILLIPGGIGTRREVDNADLLEWIAAQASLAECVTSVCTGSALLSKAGVLNGLKATTNKLAFGWVESVSASDVEWIKSARWVEDGKIFTSSGISAGIDMTLRVIEKYYGLGKAESIASNAEYIWNSDSADDPFAI